jgi:ATP-dependent DNA ligase
MPNWLRYSESFDDGIELLKAADRMKLEGIVSKRRDAPDRPGKQAFQISALKAAGEELSKAIAIIESTEWERSA